MHIFFILSPSDLHPASVVQAFVKLEEWLVNNIISKAAAEVRVTVYSSEH